MPYSSMTEVGPKWSIRLLEMPNRNSEHASGAIQKRQPKFVFHIHAVIRGAKKVITRIFRIRSWVAR